MGAEHRRAGAVEAGPARPVDLGPQPLSALDLREVTDTVHDPYVPTVLICAPDLTVRRVYDGYWMWGRPSLADLWADLRDVGASLRPDWTAPHA